MATYNVTIETEDDEALGQFTDTFLQDMLPFVVDVEIEQVEE